jgi:hypothetical protein
MAEYSRMKLKSTDMTPIHYVYWFHLDSHTDPKTEGYVGIATDHKRRERDHRRNPRLIALCGDSRPIFTLLAREVTREEAARIEWEHRKQPLTGWNQGKGGGKFRPIFEREGDEFHERATSSKQNPPSPLGSF